MADIAISVEGLGKAYRIGSKAEREDTLVGALAALALAPWRNLHGLRRLTTPGSDAESADTLWALREVSFEVRQGETLGIIGRNGAGKSTLLKILSRITPPTRGRARIHGRVSSLLEVGTGFHSELTGRENVYLNGSILGMKRREIERKFDEIIAFSGVERFLDTPVKRYSSGMKVRLAFAVAAHLEPEILIIDEVLAVGDAEFQAKCLGKMQGVADSGRTVLFVSHNMGAIQGLCDLALALRAGQVIDSGGPAEVVGRYLASMRSQTDAFVADNPHRSGNGLLRVVAGSVLDGRGRETDKVVAGEPLALRVEYQAPRSIRRVSFRFTIHNDSGVAIATLSTRMTGSRLENSGHRGSVRCTIPRLPLSLGDYYVDLSVRHDKVLADAIPAALRFTVTDSTFFPSGRSLSQQKGLVYLDHAWESWTAE